MMPDESVKTDIPSLNRLREATAKKGAPPFRVGIVIGPGYFPLDMVGVQAVLGTMPGAEIYLVWKSREPVEGFRNWWTIPTATFSDCPDLDVVAVPMMPPEVQNDREVVNFVATRGRKARYVIGVCNGVLTLGAAGLLRGKRATVSHNSHSILPLYGVTEVVADKGVVADGNVYTAGPGVGSFEAALLVAEQAFGRPAAQLAEFLIEYNPHPPFGTGTAAGAGPTLVAKFEGMMADMISVYRSEALKVAAIG
jgi:transcriptional regulator GlxA family with amidase domain